MAWNNSSNHSGVPLGMYLSLRVFSIHPFIWILICSVFFEEGDRYAKESRVTEISLLISIDIYTLHILFFLKIVSQTQIQFCDYFTSFLDTSVVCLLVCLQVLLLCHSPVGVFLPGLNTLFLILYFGTTILSAKVANVATRLEGFRQKRLPQSSAPDWNFEWHHHLLRFFTIAF